MSVRPPALFAALCFVPCLLGAQEPAAELFKVSPSFGGMVRPDEAIALRLDRPLPPAAGRLAVMIGHTDWSALFEATDRSITYRPTTVLLPAGAQEVSVYLVTPANEWRLLGQFPVQVGTGSPPPRDLVPTFDLANKGQVREGHLPVANGPPRSTFQDYTLNAGIRTQRVRGAWTTRAHVNLFGVSNRAEALRFGDMRGAAPRVDLAGYLVSTGTRRVTLSLGHVTFGTNRLLLNNFASRGAVASIRFGSRADLALSALNGSTVVGWSNFLGVGRPSHRVVGGTLGLEVIPARPGGLRLEASLLDGKVLPLTNFNQGRINDAEESRGRAVRMVASDAKQKFHLDGGYSQSTFRNPADPLLAQGATVVPVAAETRNARYLDVSYALVQGKALGKNTPANLVATYRHEQVDPLYGSVVADLKTDLLQHVVDLTGNIGPATAQVSYTRAHDNLGKINSIVKTFTRLAQVNAALPLGSLWKTTGTNDSWWPSLTYTLNQIHQMGAGVPINSDFSSLAQIPNEMTTDQAVGAEWQRTRFRLGYRVNRTFQDNRQAKKESSDLWNFVHNVTLDLMPDRDLDMQVALAFEGARNTELKRTDVTRRLGLNSNWRITPRTAFSGLVSTALLRNDPRTSTGRDTEVSLQCSQTVPLWTRGPAKRQGQFFIRYARQSALRLDRLFLIDNRHRLWTFNTGFNVSVF